jgi:hypothetical protein
MKESQNRSVRGLKMGFQPQNMGKSNFYKVVACALITMSTTFAGTAQQTEYSVKAAFILNFLKFIEWPTESGPFKITVLGKNPFGSALDDVFKGKTVRGRRIQVKYGTWDQQIDADLVFVPASEKERFGELSSLANKPIVVVGESPGFAKKHGMINFTLVQDRVAFEINPKMAKSSKVKLSSKLLQLAKIVDGGR